MVQNHKAYVNLNMENSFKCAQMNGSGEKGSMFTVSSELLSACMLWSPVYPKARSWPEALVTTPPTNVPGVPSPL